MKDAKGHGSEARGGGSYMNIDRSAFRKNGDGTRQHVGYGDGTFRIAKDGGGYRATEQRTGESFRGDSLGHISSQLTDRAAKAELARGNPKAAAVPVHPAMGSPFNHTSMNLHTGAITPTPQSVKPFGR